MKSTRIFLSLIGRVGVIFFLISWSVQAADVVPSPEYAKAYRESVVFFNELKYEEALVKVKESIALEPELTDGYNLEGACYIKLKEYEKGAESFSKILNVEPQNPIAMFNYGESLFLQKKYAEAKSLFQRYLGTEGNSKNALGRYKVILCDVLGGHVEEARKTVAGLKPTISHPLEYYARAAVEFQAGNDELARSYLKSSFQIYSGDLNLAFADSLREIGWVKDGEVAQFNTVNVAGLESLSSEFQPEAEEDSAVVGKQLNSLLPSLVESEEDDDK